MHTDLQLDQFIMVNGMYKLNEFNHAKFLSWDTEQGEHCGFHFCKQGGCVSQSSAVCTSRLSCNPTSNFVLSPVYSGELQRSFDTMQKLKKSMSSHTMVTCCTFY
jgi:hypothetical protein